MGNARVMRDKGYHLFLIIFGDLLLELGEGLFRSVGINSILHLFYLTSFLS